jgi:transcriptional antiterminator RfaH
MDKTLVSPSAWYAANIKRNAFAQVERSLKLRGVNVFAPKLERSILRYGKRRQLVSLLFPGYLFVDCNEPANLWTAIRATEGRARLVLDSKNHPTPVPSNFMAMLLSRYSSDGNGVLGEELEVGNPVSVLSGPFAGLITKIEEVDEQQRIWILLDLLGGQRRVSMPPENLLRLSG